MTAVYFELSYRTGPRDMLLVLRRGRSYVYDLATGDRVLGLGAEQRRGLRHIVRGARR